MHIFDTLITRLDGRYFPPVDAALYDYGSYESQRMIEQFIDNCKKLVELNGDGKKSGINLGLYEWLEKILDATSVLPIVFFGRALYGETDCGTRDLDCMRCNPLYSDSPDKRMWHPPNYVTVLELYEDSMFQNISRSDLLSLFSGPLLVLPAKTKTFVIDRIDERREQIIRDDSKDYFLREKITQAAAKIINSSEAGYFGNRDESEFFKGRSISSQGALLIDPGSQRTLADVKYTYERQLSQIPDKELTNLALAALRRMRVKKIHRDRLARDYVKKIRHVCH